MRTKPKVGQIVFSLNVGNAARNQPSVLTPMTVTFVGRKYFTVKEDGNGSWAETKHLIENWRQVTNHSCDSVLFESRKEYEEVSEARQICERLNALFPYSNGSNPSGLTLAQLRDMLIISQRKDA